MKKVLSLIVLSVVMFGCGVDIDEHNMLKLKYETLSSLNNTLVLERDSLLLYVNFLEKEIDSLKYGEQRIIGLIENTLLDKNYIMVESYIQILFDKHPESNKRKYYEDMLKTIAPKVKKQKDVIEKHRQDSIRMANINNLGRWAIEYFVDDFGQETKKGYITTSYPIYGTFSNSATENSDLRVRFIIANKKSVAIQLFEYNGNNPVKGYDDDYRVLVQDKDGNQYKFRAYNNSDRIRFSNTVYYGETMSDSEKMHDILLKGGNIKVKIIESDWGKSQYFFEIYNADWYENAYIKLHGFGK